MRSAIKGLNVDMNGLEKVKANISRGYKVIFMPLYKSFMDYFILTYVHSMQGIESGFTFGSFEDTPKIMLLDHLLKTTGYIKSRRNKS